MHGEKEETEKSMNSDEDLDCPYSFYSQDFGQLDVPNDNESGIDASSDELDTPSNNLYDLRQSDTSSDSETDSDEEEDDYEDDEVEWPLVFPYEEELLDAEMQELIGVLHRIMSKKTREEAKSIEEEEANKIALDAANDELEWEYQYFSQEDPNEEDAAH